RAFQAASALAFTVLKSFGAPKLVGLFSRVKLSRALAMLTKEMPILTCTTWLELALKVTKAPVSEPLPEEVPPEVTVPPFQVPLLVQERSNCIEKNTR